MLHLGDRFGDKADMALLQLVEEGDTLQPKHGKRREPRPEDPNAPTEIKKQALDLGTSAADAEAEAAQDEAETQPESDGEAEGQPEEQQ
jgi:hypothetical protein